MTVPASRGTATSGGAPTRQGTPISDLQPRTCIGGMVSSASQFLSRARVTRAGTPTRYMRIGGVPPGGLRQDLRKWFSPTTKPKGDGAAAAPSSSPPTADAQPSSSPPVSSPTPPAPVVAKKKPAGSPKKPTDAAVEGGGGSAAKSATQSVSKKRAIAAVEAAAPGPAPSPVSVDDDEDDAFTARPMKKTTAAAATPSQAGKFFPSPIFSAFPRQLGHVPPLPAQNGDLSITRIHLRWCVCVRAVLFLLCVFV